MSTRKQTLWRNWAGNQRCVPASVERPETEADLIAIVSRAAVQGQRVKAVGAGHSFTSIACTDGTLIDLSGYSRLLSVDSGRQQVTVQAGITVATLNQMLSQMDLALENIGDIAYQSIAGATATATHGTGLRFRNMSSAIVAMRIVTGDGTVLSCSSEHEADVLAAARVGVGALGIVSEVTLQCVPAFNLHAVEEAAYVDAVLERLDELVEGNDHYELFWVPGTRWALTKRNRRTDEPVRPRPRWQAFRNDALIDNVGFGAVQRIGVRRPDLIPRLAKRLPGTGRQEYIDHSYRVFASKRWVRFVEMEYAVPREAFPSAFAGVRSLVARLGEPIGFPVECRFVAGDDIPLSTAFGRDTAYIAVHLAIGRPYDQYFQGVEAIMDDHDGRPHWGKLHFQSAATLAPRYPRWEKFQGIRRRLDPDGRFANPYTDRVLGRT
jgi:FAD-linked oxidoreductase